MCAHQHHSTTVVVHPFGILLTPVARFTSPSPPGKLVDDAAKAKMSAEKSKAAGVRHVVMFKFKEGSDKAAVGKLFSDGLAELPGKVCSINSTQTSQSSLRCCWTSDISIVSKLPDKQHASGYK